MRSAAAAACLLACAPAFAGLKVGDAQGRRVSDATVTILLESNNKAGEVFKDEPVVHRTDERGVLPFDLPRIDGATVVIDHQRYAPVTFAIDAAKPSQAVTLHEGITLAGRLTGDGQTPPGPGTVCAVRTVSTPRNRSTLEVARCAPVAGDGTWTLHALPSGTQQLKIDVPAYLPLVKTISPPMATWSGALDAGLRVLLYVENAAGRPAAGATVECDGAVSATADARGAALVSIAKSGANCRAFTAEGAESGPLSVEAPSDARQTLRLRPVRVVTGTLLMDDGGELETPRFTLLGKIGDIGQSATRAEPLSIGGGAFRIRLPVEGPHALRIEAPGTLPLTTAWFTLPPGGGTADLGTLVLRRGAGVRGRVVHAATQTPLAGALVSLEAQGRARIILGTFGKVSAITDDDGSFTVAGAGIGSYRMRVAWHDLPPFETAVDLREERVVTAAPIALHPGVRVSGNVARDDREPLRAVRVDLIPARLYDTEPVASTYTTDDGTFAVAVAPGRYRLLVRGDDILSDQEIDVPADEESVDVDVRIRSTRLTGTIRDHGVPVSGGEVLLQRSADLRGNLGVAVARNPRMQTQFWSGRSESQYSATVDGAGMFSLSDVPAGRMVLEYYGIAGQRVTRTIDVPDRKDASVTIDIDGWALQGRVDDGEVEAGLVARVELVDSEGTAMFRGSTNGAGTFSIDRLPPGTYNLVAAAEGYRSSDPLQVVIGNEAPPPVHVRLTKAGEATLDLELKREGSVPAAGVAVAVIDAVGRQLRAFPTWPDGTLHITDLPPGKVYVIWSDPLAGVGMSPPIQLRAGVQQMSVRLEPGKDLIARCEAADCRGARLGSFAFTSEHGIDLAPFLSRMGAVVYSDGGSAYLGRLGPGTYNVSSSSGALRLSQQLELGSGPGEVNVFLTRR